MCSLMEQIVSVAIATFSKDVVYPDFTENFNELVNYVSLLKPSDVRVDESMETAPGHAKRIFPCFYISVCVTETFLIGIYILKPGVTIPLHDHPGMHAILKVIEGPVRISSYTSMGDEPSDKMIPQDVKDKVKKSHGYNAMLIPVNKHEPKVVSKNDEPWVLMPKEGNFREVSAMKDMAVFVDIIAPPFDMVERECTFYKAVESDEQDAAIKTWLVKTPPDVKFFSTDLPYCGPAIKL